MIFFGPMSPDLKRTSISDPLRTVQKYPKPLAEERKGAELRAPKFPCGSNAVTEGERNDLSASLHLSSRLIPLTSKSEVAKIARRTFV
jgi:hypothetical protein